MRKVAARLWIGNALEARDLSVVFDADIAAIVDLAIEEPPISATRELVCLRIPIVDGGGNAPAHLRLAVETVCQLVSSGVPTLVACSAGMSRSPVVVAAALSRLRKIGLEEALTQIAKLGPCDPSPSLVADFVAASKLSSD